MRKDIIESEFVKICEVSNSMAEACAKLGLHFNTFKRYAILFGCYKPNQGGVGIKKDIHPKISLGEILNGEQPQYQTFKLKNRLIKEGIFKNECSVCGLDSWLDKPISIELDHIDGNSNNHRLENLRMLCPNCHSQTETYRSKKRN